MALLSESQIQSALQSLSGWQSTERGLRKVFEFDDFVGAMGFVIEVAQLAEDAEHHPDIDIRYNKVILTLITHDEDGVTQQDVRLAREIEGMV